MADVINYLNGQKNNWRRALWNRIERHASNKYESLILYLPGERNLDWIEAQRRKYKQHCLVAVDRDPRIVNRIRGEGGIAINADLFDVMACWPATYPVDFVIADLQCPMIGIVGDLLQLWWFSPAFRRAALLLNIQRGRETGGFGDAFAWAKHGIAKCHSDDHKNNRAVLSFVNVCMAIGVALSGKVPEDSGQSYVVVPPGCTERINEVSQTIDFQMFRSYRSAPRAPIMDSGIFRHRMKRHPSSFIETRNLPDASLEVKRLISAAMAIRTSRMNLTIPARRKAVNG